MSLSLPGLELSIIIVNWNTEDLLRNCLNSVYTSINGTTNEVIIVDNASSDNSVDMVKAEYPQAVLIENSRNHGFANANNQAMKIAKGRYLLLLNSDTIVLNDAIAKTLSFADNHPKAAVLGCRVLNGDKTLQPTCFMFPSLLNMLLSTTYLYKLFSKNKFFGRERIGWWDRDNVRQVDVVTGCFMLVRRQAIKQVGLMDERFFMYAEETDWCCRFKKAGWKVMFSPDAEIIHFGGQSSKKIKGQMLLQSHLSVLGFIKKHYSWLEYRLACLLSVIFFLVRIPAWFFVAVFWPNKRKQAVIRLKTYCRGLVKAFFQP